ncbi:MAG: AAA family ATPase [Verrucomicrobia bacterium]|nr:AAA family ATPase [Verrucomicrobiota bacterium]
MIELSKHVFEPLRRDEDSILYRGRGEDDSSQVLVLAPAKEDPRRESVKRFEHEYSLREELDPAWAVRPIGFAFHWNRPVLVLHDPGGRPLSQLRSPASELGSSLRVAINLAAAIGQVHRRGLVHKDIKPGNILANSATGGVWLMGFGIASRLPRERQSPDAPAFVAGTLPYMAPEQTGRMNRSIDSRSDLYALGVTLYEMLTGTLPFTASDSMEWVHCHIARQPVPPDEWRRDLPLPVSAIVLKLLSKTAEDRYQTADGLLVDLKKCLTEWESERRIGSFTLGAHDIADRLLTPEKLYGRDREIKTLLDAFDQVVTTGKPNLVLVSGYSGIGKSSVVNELHKAIVLPRGIFVSGKFDQHKRDIPYATLSQAFQTLIRREILSKSQVELDRWRSAIRDAVGLYGQLMVNLIPEVELVIGEQPPVPELPPTEADNRFHRVFRAFLGVFASKEHPLALFLDDLQWLDAATLKLLEHLMIQPDIGHLLLMGAFRDNEVSSSHPLSRTLDAIRQSGAIVRDITLAPLSFEDVNEFVADTLHCEQATARPLAWFVHEKTLGNPFFVIQFMAALYEERLLVFDADEAIWKWDLDRIHARRFTDNVVDLMVTKLERLPAGTRETLKQLACLGNMAGITTLAMVEDRSEEEVQADLWQALRQGLILRLDSSCKFAHDRIQEAAYSLVPRESRVEAHLRIGRILLSRMTSAEIAENIFDVVNQLNIGAAHINDWNEKQQIAELNFRAGRRAKTSTAYASACVYLSAAMALLGDRGWTSRYELTFAVWLERAESEFLSGSFDEAERLIVALLGRAVSKIDKAAAYRLKLDLHVRKSEYPKAVENALDCLRLFGIEMQPHPSNQQVQLEFEKVWQNLGDRSINTLIDLPLMTDPEMQAAMRVLAALVGPALYTDINLTYLHLCHMVNVSLKFGTTDASAHGYVWFGLILGPFAHRYADGYRFGKVACDLVEKPGFLAYKAKTYFCMELVCCWTQPIQTAIDFIRAAFTTAVETGDLTFACYSCNHLITDLLLQGVHLDEVWRESEQCLDFDRKVKFRDAADIVVSQQRFIQNLRGNTLTFSSFNDAQFDEDTFESELTADRMATMVCWYWILKLEARFLLGDYVAAVAAAERAKAMIAASYAHIQLLDYHYYSALLICALHPTASPEFQNVSREELSVHVEQLREWAGSGPETFTDKYRLVSAEVARIDGRDLDAMRLYEEAIQAARDNGFLQNEAVANELASRFYSARGFKTIAHAYLRNARYCYLRWGALGKVRQIDQEYSLLQEERAVSAAATIETPAEQLDLATVMKVSQAVSGEIVLEQLIKTLMGIAIAHAGAERGLLILPFGEEYCVVAEAKTGRDQVEVQVKQAPVVSRDLPDSLLRYVLRTQESVILDDAFAETTSRRVVGPSVAAPGRRRTPAGPDDVANLFAEDEYIRQRRPRSILCLPLVKQAKLMGALYLENNLASGVFTPRRLAMLELLASQAAISLDHARLYADLIQENNDRRRAEEALRASEERWGMLAENSSAGIAVIAPSGRFIAANVALQKMLGYTEPELQARTAASITHEEDRPATEARAHIAEADEWQRRVYRLEKRFLRKDGEILWADVSTVFVPARESISAFFSVVIIDITKRKLAEEKLQQNEISLREAQNELAHVSRLTMIGELAASIAHEVNQPLAGMLTNANASLRWLAGDSPDLAEARDAIQRIVRDGNRASDVITRMRALIKKAPAAHEPIAINTVIQEVLALTQPELRRNRVLLQTALADDLPIVFGDRVQLQQVILNLVMNAIEAMNGIAEGARELQVSSQRMTGNCFDPGKQKVPAGEANERAQSFVLIAIRDSGPGLDPAQLEQIFETFYTTKSLGMGMGLAISRSIVEAHHGWLWGISNEPKGAIFQFTLPCQPGL